MAVFNDPVAHRIASISYSAPKGLGKPPHAFWTTTITIKNEDGEKGEIDLFTDTKDALKIKIGYANGT